jgi:hypothetical protein
MTTRHTSPHVGESGRGSHSTSSITPPVGVAICLSRVAAASVTTSSDGCVAVRFIRPILRL